MFSRWEGISPPGQTILTLRKCPPKEGEKFLESGFMRRIFLLTKP
jgi:hypothetical protein